MFAKYLFVPTLGPAFNWKFVLLSDHHVDAAHRRKVLCQLRSLFGDISKLDKDLYGRMSPWQGSKCIATSEIIAADLYVHMNIGGMAIFMYYYQCFRCP